MQRFTIPRDIYFGDNAIEHLKSVRGSKAMLVIGSERLINLNYSWSYKNQIYITKIYLKSSSYQTHQIIS